MQQCDEAISVSEYLRIEFSNLAGMDGCVVLYTNSLEIHLVFLVAQRILIKSYKMSNVYLRAHPEH